MIYRTALYLLAALASSTSSLAFQEVQRPGLTLPVARTTVWLDRPGVLSFRRQGPATADETFAVEVDDKSIAEPMSRLEFLAGETTGFVRVRGRRIGETTLRVHGQELGVRVAACPVDAPGEGPEPILVAPSRGAAIQGQVGVGVELGPGFDPERRAQVRLELADGQGAASGPPRDVHTRGPERRMVFPVNAKALPPGPTSLVAITSLDGVESCSDPLPVTVVHGPPALSFRLADTVGGVRPEEYDQRQPSLARDPDVPGGTAVVIRGYQGVPLVQAEIPERGHWQVIARLRGDLGAGAFPSVTLLCDGQGTSVGQVRVTSERWSRIPVGGPVELEAGAHVFGLRLGNYVEAGRAEQRTLYADSLELVPVHGAGPVAAPSIEGTMMQGGQSMEMAGGSSPDLPMGQIWIGLHNVFDGLPMTGKLKLMGTASWDAGEPSTPPEIQLMVDGEVRATTRTNEPIFTVYPEELGSGEHRVWLRALRPTSGGEAPRAAVDSVPQTLVVPPGVERAEEVPEFRFATLDDGWTGLETHLEPGTLGSPQGPVSAARSLPDEWSGRFEVLLDARGPGGDAAATAHVAILAEGPDGPRALKEGDLTIQNWWNERSVLEVDLKPGPKRVHLTLTPSKSEEAGAEVLFARSVIFRRVAGADLSPPFARLVYPARDAKVHGIDAVVVEAFDTDAAKSAELFVDGRPTGNFGRIPEGAGRTVIPLFTESLPLGEHEIFVRVVDGAGHEGDSERVRIQVTASHGTSPGRLRRAVHLLNRLGFGPSTQDLARVLTLGEGPWLEDALSRDVGDRAAREVTHAVVGGRIPYSATQLALRSALNTDNPVRSRFVFFVDNHFNTWSGKTGVPAEYGDHRRWQELGFSPFPELLRAATSSPVLLRYLDQQLSFRNRVNENFARELMELHTVGVDGGYDQGDVAELAELLTGLTVTEEAPPSGSPQYRALVCRFAPDLAEPSGAAVLGARFHALEPSTQNPPVLGEDPSRAGYVRLEWIVAHLGAHPRTARFWSMKIAQHYVGPDASTDLIESLETTFLESGGDPRPMLRALVGHQDFWKSMGRPRMTTPLEYGLRLGRATAPRHLHGQIDKYMKAAGMGLFEHEAPDGYSSRDEDYIDSNAMLARWSLPSRFPWGMRVLAPEEVRRDFGDGDTAFGQRAVRHAAFALLGAGLGKGSTEALMEYLDEIGDEPHWKRVDLLTQLIARMPEASAK